MHIEEFQRICVGALSQLRTQVVQMSHVSLPADPGDSSTVCQLKDTLAKCLNEFAFLAASIVLMKEFPNNSFEDTLARCRVDSRFTLDCILSDLIGRPNDGNCVRGQGTHGFMMHDRATLKRLTNVAEQYSDALTRLAREAQLQDKAQQQVSGR